MAIKTYRPTTSTLRFQTALVNEELTTASPHKPLTETRKGTGGRRNSGDITSWFRGGGHKRQLPPNRLQTRQDGGARAGGVD